MIQRVGGFDSSSLAAIRPLVEEKRPFGSPPSFGPLPPFHSDIILVLLPPRLAEDPKSIPSPPSFLRGEVKESLYGLPCDRTPSPLSPS